MKTKATIQNPDFAFPATVAADAQSEMKKIKVDENLSLADQDLYLSLQIQYYIATVAVDCEESARVIRELENVIPKVRETTLRSMLRTWLAKIYFNYYSLDRWKFNRRSLPLEEPYPKHISEWSAEMFSNRIARIARLALNEAMGANVPLSNFKKSVNSKGIETKISYPGVADFVAARLVDMCNSIDNDKAAGELRETFTSTLVSGTAPAVAWQISEIVLSSNWDKVQPRLSELLSETQDAEASALLLLALTNFTDTDSDLAIDAEEEDFSPSTGSIETESKPFFPAWLADKIKKHMGRYPDGVLVDKLRNALFKLSEPSVKVSMPSKCFLDKVNACLEVRSASKVVLSVFSVPDEVAFDREKLKKFSKRKPDKTVELQYTQQIPYIVNDSVELSLPDYGYYMIVPEVFSPTVEQKPDGWPDYVLIQRVPVLPVLLTEVASPRGVLLNAGDGSPVTDAEVSIVEDRVALGTYVTDTEGIFSLGKSLSRYVNARVKYNGKYYQLPRYWNNETRSRKEDTNYSARVLTDRALYHLGDELNFVAVVSFMSKFAGDVDANSAVAKGKEVTVTLVNANYQDIDTLHAVTDDFGRVSGKFNIPKEGLTGRFRVKVALSEDQYKILGSNYVVVSDYQMSQFEITDLRVERDTPEVGDVTLQGRVMTYSGMPVADADIEVNLSTYTFLQSWHESSDIDSYEFKSDAEGKFSKVFPASILSAEKDSDGFFIAWIYATSPAGETVEESIPFSVGKPYIITLNLPSININSAEQFDIPCKVIDLSSKNFNIDLNWQLMKSDKTVVTGGAISGPVSLRDVMPGQYVLRISPVDPTLAEPVESSVLIYNVESDIIPTDEILWTPVDQVTSQSAPGKVLVTTSAPLTHLYTVINIGDSILSISCDRYSRGYHYLDIDLPEGCASAKINIFAVWDCKLYHETLYFKQSQPRDLKIIAESMREKLTPSSTETWKFRITDSKGNPVKSALVLDLYNKALDALQSHSLNLSFPYYRTNNSLNIISDNSRTVSLVKSVPFAFRWSTVPPIPLFNDYGVRLSNQRVVVGYGTVMRKGVTIANSDESMEEKSMAEDVVLNKTAYTSAITDSEAIDGSISAGATSKSESFDFRDSDVPVAAWAPMLTTDDEGFLTFTFTVPNAVTTWRLLATAWDQNTQVGNLMRDFIANKPLMVQPLMPRFLRQGDTAEIRATVYNNTDSATRATVTFELFNPGTGQSINVEQKLAAVDAGGQTVVTFPLSTLQNGLESLSAVGVRVKVTGDTFADGETTVIPLLSSMAQLVETEPFYLNPGQEQFSTVLPEGKDAQLSLTYCSNPVWSVVSALPGLREQYDYANSAAAALFSASVARGILADNPKISATLSSWIDNPQDSMLMSNLEKNDDLKIALLSATPWVENAMTDTERMQRLALIFDKNETGRAVSRAVETLKKLQCADGGFAWGSWSKSSSYWVTMSVLEMMSDLVRFGRLPDDAALRKILVKALGYADKKAEKEDLLYAAVRPSLANISPISQNGKKVIANTVNSILKSWKTYPISIKAIAAYTLFVNNYKTKSKELLRSLEEFSVDTPSQGVTFPNINSLSAYSCVLEAFSLIEPSNPMVDGLRQQLIVRKQATDWGSAVVTTQVVNAILSSGTGWTDADVSEPAITVGNVAIHPAPSAEDATGTLRLNLSPYAGAELLLRRRGDAVRVPSYGSVYARFKQQMADVKAQACEDLSIEKKIYKRSGTGWIAADSLNAGDRVKVSLTIISKRNLQYVSLIDERPAAFAPVDQLPGWIYSEHTMFYRENRDATTNLSIDYLSPGTYILEYEMNVQHAGVFSSGVASIQSQYAPEISAHSSGTSLHINR